MDDTACTSAAAVRTDAVADPHKSVILPSPAETRIVIIAANYGLRADRLGVNHV